MCAVIAGSETNGYDLTGRSKDGQLYTVPIGERSANSGPVTLICTLYAVTSDPHTGLYPRQPHSHSPAECSDKMAALDLIYESPLFVRATATWLSVLATSVGGIVVLALGIYLYVGPWSVYTCGFRDLKGELSSRSFRHRTRISPKSPVDR